MKNDNLATNQLKDVNDGKVTSNSSSHPLGTTLGTIGGAGAGVAGAIVAGAAAGVAAGPAGAALGAAVGGVIGAMTGHEIAAQVNPKEEDLFWRENFSTRPYVKAGSQYDIYQPAYTYGINSYAAHNGKDFDDIESDLGDKWHATRGSTHLEWNDARPAVRDAYDRLHKTNA